MNETKRLEARVVAVNRANAYAKMIYPKLAAVFKNFIGTKVYKADDSLLKKVKESIPPLPEVAGVRCWVNASGYSLYWGVQAYESADDCAMYSDVSVYIGEISNGVLVSITTNHWENVRTDFTAEEITEKRVEYKRLEEIANKAKSALFPFGEYDR